MDVKTGDLVAVETERVGLPERHGEVLEVIEGSTGVSYRVRWTDDHESIIRPAAGAIRVIASA